MFWDSNYAELLSLTFPKITLNLIFPEQKLLKLNTGSPNHKKDLNNSNLIYLFERFLNEGYNKLSLEQSWLKRSKFIYLRQRVNLKDSWMGVTTTNKITSP